MFVLSMGVGRGGRGRPWPPRILKLLAKKVVFSISRGKNQISPLLAPPGKNFGKIPYWPPLEKIFPTPMVLSIMTAWAQFCCKMWGGQLGVKAIQSSGRCRSDVLYIQIPTLISKGILRATLIKLCSCRWVTYCIIILKFVVGHGTVVQPASINIDLDANKHSNIIEHIDWASSEL